MKLKFKILDSRIGSNFPIPKHQTSGSAGIDLIACIDDEMILDPNESTIISSGIAIFIEDSGYAGIVIPLTGLIDSDYQGPLSISLWNRSDEPISINPGDRVAQLVVLKVNQVELEQVDEFTESERGEMGFGSTGKN
jgi:dUTP pyrophosphatase